LEKETHQMLMELNLFFILLYYVLLTYYYFKLSNEFR
jgi:hypothetical protein